MLTNSRRAETSQRPVPWTPGFALFLFIIYVFVLPLIAGGIVTASSGYLPKFDAIATEPNSEHDVADSDDSISSDSSHFTDEKIARQHPMARILIRSYSTPYFPMIVTLFFLTVVVLAPTAEELLFRVAIQGSIETALGLHSPVTPELSSQGVELNEEERRVLSAEKRDERRRRRFRVAIAIILPALLFALLHITSPDDPESPEPLSKLFELILVSGLVNLFMIVFGVSALIWGAGAKLSDLGLDTDFSIKDAGFSIRSVFRFFQSVNKFCSNWLKGVAIFFVAAPVVLGANKLTNQFLPPAFAPVIPIFLFALVLGYIFYTKKKFARILGMHMTLNFISFLTILLQLGVWRNF